MATDVKEEKHAEDVAEGGDDADKAENKEVPKVPFSKLFRFADGTDAVLMSVGFIGAALLGISLPAFSLFFGELTDALFETDPEKSADGVQAASILFLWVAVGSQIAGIMQITCYMISGERQMRRCREQYVRAILRQDISWFDSGESGTLTTRLSSDTLRMQEGLGEKLGMLAQYVVGFVSAFILGFVKGWQLTLVILAVMPPIAIVGAVMGSMLGKVTKLSADAYSGAGAIAQETIGNMRTVTAFGGAKRALDAYGDKLTEARIMGIKKSRFSAIGFGVFMLFMFLSQALGFWYGGTLITDGLVNAATGEKFTGGDVVAVFFAVLMGAMIISQAGPAVEAINEGRAAAYDIYGVLDRESKQDAFSDEGLKPDPKACRGEIKLENVTFRYPARPEAVIFEDLSITIEAGKTTALVGASGSGKSTVVQLVERFYDPEQGKLSLDGVDLKDLNLRWLRSRMGLVGQEPILFNASLADNVRYGKPDATLDEIKAVCRQANIHDFISSLPEAYDTMVGERGVQLSGGQKQRVAIARALVKQPAIMLLDEATSALDAESEAIVQEALDGIMGDRTTIVIAHRLSTIAGADCILVFESGSVVESGTHAELMAIEDGAYNALVKQQVMAGVGGLPGEESKYGDGEEAKAVDRPEAAAAAAVAEEEEDADGSKPKSARVVPLTIADGAGSKGKDKGKDKGEGAGADGYDSDDDEELKEVKVPMSRLMEFNRPEWWVAIIGLLGAAGNGSVMPLSGFVMVDMLEVFYYCEPFTLGSITIYGPDGLTDQDKCFDELNARAGRFALLFVALAVGGGLAVLLQVGSFGYMGEWMTQRLRLKLFGRVLRQEIGWFDDRKQGTGRLTTRLAVEAAHVQNLVGTQLGTMVQSIATMGIGLGLAFYHGWELTLIIFALTPVMMCASYMEIKAMGGSTAKGAEEYESAGALASEAVSGIRTVASFCAEEHVVRLFDERLAVAVQSGRKRAWYAGIGFGFSQAGQWIIFMLAFFIGGIFIRDGTYTGERVMQIFFALVMSASGLGQTAAFAPGIAKGQVAVPKVFSIIDRESEIDPMAEGGKTLPDVRGDIEFDNVDFHYPSRPDVTIFKGLSLSVDAGTTVALVGSSGGGKSTVISLLERFYNPISGSIRLDGVELRDLNLAWLRSVFGLVSQEPILFDATIVENIKYGLEGDVSMDDVREAARIANAADFIDGLPAGYDTPVAEMGSHLSGGQRQRIAIARAVLRNPKILLLDEATSALDAESEVVVQDALDKIMKGRTTLVIAHRLSTIQDADCILAFAEGKVLEKGTHAELMGEDGLYAQLVRRQMAAA